MWCRDVNENHVIDFNQWARAYFDSELRSYIKQDYVGYISYHTNLLTRWRPCILYFSYGRAASRHLAFSSSDNIHNNGVIVNIGIEMH